MNSRCEYEADKLNEHGKHKLERQNYQQNFILAYPRPKREELYWSTLRFKKKGIILISASAYLTAEAPDHDSTFRRPVNIQ